jgi:hypothetical protein
MFRAVRPRLTAVSRGRLAEGATLRITSLAALAALACCGKSDVKNGGLAGSAETPQVVPKPTFTVFGLAEMRGQIGPCGCTSDPLGDISRTAKLVVDARAAGPTLVVDAGSLLYSKSPIPLHQESQEELKADLLVRTYKDRLQSAAVGIGHADLVKGPAKLRFPRQAVNIAGAETAPPQVVAIGGTQVGVFGVVTADAVTGVEVKEPVAAAKAAVADLKKRGAQVVIGLVQATTRRDAATLVREIGGIDLAIAGLGINTPEPERVVHEAQKINDSWLVVPANRGQVLARLDVTVRGPGPFVDAGGVGAAKAKIATIDQQLATLDADIARFKADPNADKSFVSQKIEERAGLQGQRERLKKQPFDIPKTGNYFTLEMIRVSKGLACDKVVHDDVTAFYRASGEANVKAAAGVKPPPAAKGQPGYVGDDACADCHEDAVEFWKKTRHAGAWKTLVDRGQQFDYDCIGCHVTGWAEKGGANLAFNEPLRDVQCETCHGPASIHLAKLGEEKPVSVKRAPPEALCLTQCHTKEHSDTFEWKAYMRDVTGPGHGPVFREKLGDGPTGAQLRKAALDKAGRTLGAGCAR